MPLPSACFYTPKTLVYGFRVRGRTAGVRSNGDELPLPLPAILPLFRIG